MPTSVVSNLELELDGDRDSPLRLQKQDNMADTLQENSICSLVFLNSSVPRNITVIYNYNITVICSSVNR
jgi:hypothetical protein